MLSEQVGDEIFVNVSQTSCMLTFSVGALSAINYQASFRKILQATGV